MGASILSIGTAVPTARVSADRRARRVREPAGSQPHRPAAHPRRVRRLRDRLPQHGPHRPRVVPRRRASRSADGGDALRRRPKARSSLRRRERATTRTSRLAPPLFAAAAAQALTEAGVAPDEVTHVVTVSCTGMFAPGPDFRLVKDLGLPADVERFHIGFMGCAAALPGPARGSAHLRRPARCGRAGRGRGAVHAAHPLVGGSAADRRGIRLRRRRSRGRRVGAAAEGRTAARARAIRHGPHQRGRVRHGLDDRRRGLRHGPHRRGPAHHRARDPRSRRVVPGCGRARRVGRASRRSQRARSGRIGPEPRSCRPRASRSVLRRQGNMSSATILFILRELLHDDDALGEGAAIAALAFGPASRSSRRSSPAPRRDLREPERPRHRGRRAHGRSRLRSAAPRGDAPPVRHRQPPHQRLGRRLPVAAAPASRRRSDARRACSTSGAGAATCPYGSRDSPRATASTSSGSAPTPIPARSPSPQERTAPGRRPSGARMPRPCSRRVRRFDAVLSNHVLHHLTARRAAGVRERLARAVGRDRRALRHPPQPARVRAVQRRGDAVRARDVPAHRRAAVDPPELPRRRTRGGARRPWRVSAASPFRILAVGAAVPDVIVVGAGPVGTLLAAELARQGRRRRRAGTSCAAG